MDLVVEQLVSRLHTRPDRIAPAGSGEPTLYARIGDLIKRTKAATNTPVAVLTNGSQQGYTTPVARPANAWRFR